MDFLAQNATGLGVDFWTAKKMDHPDPYLRPSAETSLLDLENPTCYETGDESDLGLEQLFAPTSLSADDGNSIFVSAEATLRQSGTHAGIKQLRIPTFLYEIKECLQKYPDHPGLLAAQTSVTNNRHPFKATLLSFTTGVQTEVICDLFGLDRYGAVKVPVKPLGVVNSSLSVERHFTVQDSIRNVVTPPTCTIFATDLSNVLQEFDTPFVDMLQEYAKLQPQNTVLQSGVVFVLALEGSSESSSKDQVECFRDIIKKYTTIKNPIIRLAHCQSNVTQEISSSEEKGLVAPSGQCYPLNVLNGMLEAISTSDPIGGAILKSAYSHFTEWGIKINLDSALNFSYLYKIPIETSEVDDALVELVPKFRHRDLFVMQSAFQSFGYFKRSDLPQSNLEIFRLILEIRQLQVFDFTPLLNKFFKTRVPTFPKNCGSGTGFALVRDEILPIKATSDENPWWDTWSLEHTRVRDYCEFVNTFEEYLDLIFKYVEDLNIISYPLRPGFNVVPQVEQTETFTACREFSYGRLFHPLGKDQPTLEVFTLAKSLPDIIDHNAEALDSDSEKKFRDFFEKFGSHFVSWCTAGGSIEIKATFDGRPEFEMADNSTVKTEISSALDKIFFPSLNKNPHEIEVFQAFSKLAQPPFCLELVMTLHGGAPEWNGREFTLDERCRTTVADLLDWKESVVLYPIILKSGLRLEAIDYLFRLLSSEISQKLKRAANILGYNCQRINFK